MTNYLVLQVGGEALGQQPITRKKNQKLESNQKNTTTITLLLYIQHLITYDMIDETLAVIVFSEITCHI